MGLKRLSRLAVHSNYLLVVLPCFFLNLLLLALLHIRLGLDVSLWVLGRPAADLLLLFFAAMLLELLFGMRRGPALVFFSAWGIFYYASFQYEVHKFRPLRFDDFRYLADPEMIQGSLLSGVNIFAICFLLGGAYVISRRLEPVRPEIDPEIGRWIRMVLLGVGAVIMLVAWQLPAGRPWQARSPIAAFAYSVVQVVEPWLTGAEKLDSPETPPERFGARVKADFREGSESEGVEISFGKKEALEPGTRIIPAAPGRNVLMVVLEGVSGAYLPEVAEETRFTPPLVMSNLNRIAARALVTPNFVIHIHQTIRGLYSLMTGDYPKLTFSTPKAFEAVAMPGAELESLPRTLSRNGYLTVFLQAAGLRFMEKDRFMKAAGFEEIHGREWFESRSARVKSAWGVDDLSFFEGAGQMLERLEAQDRPWFLTLLTVGTHHPYDLVPEDFNPEGVDDWTRSVIFLDHAVGRFFSFLEESGILDNTLVIITSDEFRGFPDKPLQCNWGLNLVLAPELNAKTVRDGLFGQFDLSCSILDYLGLETPGPFSGRRSLFREYSEPAREIFFTRDGWGQLWFRPENLLIRMDNGRAIFYRLDPRHFFRDKDLRRVRLGRDLEESLSREMNERIEALDASVSRLSEKLPLEMVLASEEKYLIQKQGVLTLADGQYFALPPSEATLDLAIINSQDSQGRIRISECYFYIGKEFKRQPLPAYPWLEPGEKIDFAYVFSSESHLRQLSFRLVVEAEGGPVTILAEELRLQARSLSPGSSENPGTVERLEVSKAGELPRSEMSRGRGEGTNKTREGCLGTADKNLK